MAGVPPDSAFGPGLMPTRPTGRGQAGYVRCVPFAASMRADGGKPTCRGLPPAVCVGDVALPCRQRRGGGSGGSAAGQCLWLRLMPTPPHGQGACGLRCVPFAASMRADGGKPTCSGLPPAVCVGGRCPALQTEAGWRFGRQCRWTVPFGSGLMPTRPTGRGHAGCGASRLQQVCGQMVASACAVACCLRWGRCPALRARTVRQYRRAAPLVAG